MRIALLLAAVSLSASVFAHDLPLVFEPNVGQAPGEFDYVARGGSGTLLLGRTGAVLLPRSGESAVRMTLAGGRGRTAEALEALPGRSHYFLGRDPSNWRTGVPHFARVRYRDVYPGVDVVYYTKGRELEYDFIVAPGFSPERIQLSFTGADRIRQDASGDLLIEAGGAAITQKKPRVYQSGSEIQAGYRVADGNVKLALGRYDRNRELVIDPVVQFSTYVGRGGYETATGIAVDGAGNTWISGETNSLEFASGGAVQKNKSGGTDAWIAKLSANGDLQYVSYLGGNQSDIALGVGTDGAGNAYLSGVTFSQDFPVRNAPQSEPGGGAFDSFAAKLNASGSELVWSTYLGGSDDDWANSMTVDSAGGAWVTGWTRSLNFPVRNAVQGATAGGASDAFLTRVDPAGRTFTYSTYFGSAGADAAIGVAVDAAGMVYLTGSTTSPAFPSVRPLQPALGGGTDAFLVKLNPVTNDILYSTFLGGTLDDSGIRVAVDSEGNAYTFGYTGSADFPTTQGAVQRKFGGKTDLFVAKVTPAGTLRFATFLGGSGDDWAGGIAVDELGTAYVAGWTNSADFPSHNPVQPAYMGGDGSISQRFDGVVARLAPGGDSLLYSSFFGGSGEDRAYGIAVDASGTVRIAGTTTSVNFPAAAAGGITPASIGAGEAFVARLSADNSVSLLTAQPSSLSVTARLGDTAAQQIPIALRSTGQALQWTAATDVPWLRVPQASGAAPGTMNVSVDSVALPAGVQTGNIVVRTPFGTATIPVTLTVLTAPAISAIAPSSIRFGSAGTPLLVTGSGYTPFSFVEISGTRVVSSFVDSGTLRVTVPAELLRTERVLEVIVVNPEVRSAAMRLPVTSDAPSVSAVVNAATWQPGGVAPGEMVIVGGANLGPDALTQSSATDGRLPTALGSTTVYFDEEAAPVLWASKNQVAVLVPWSVTGRAATFVSVFSRGTRSAPISIPVQAASPGLFTSSGTGQGQAAALNEDNSPNSPANAAERGSILVLYGTGEGLATPTLPIGSVVDAGSLPRPLLPVAVRIGGADAAVEYAGAVPGSPAGLLQINVRVPSEAPAGDAVPVLVSVGQNTSPAGVTVALR